MKIISLNTWAGKLTPKILEFLSKNQDIDVFCFQEIYHQAMPEQAEKQGLNRNLNLFVDLQSFLPNHTGYFRPHYLNIFGLAIFVKNNIFVEKEEDCFVHKTKDFISTDHFGHHAVNVQSISINFEGKKLNIFNFYGLWNGQGKTDSEDRIIQSKNIISYLGKFEGQKILCGDFNLLPNTKSIKTIEDFGLKNLIKDYNIDSTRTSYYSGEIRYADYFFISEDVKIANFQVLPDEVSDHAILEIEIV